jgi:large conductance mechanosensitive channel
MKFVDEFKHFIARGNVFDMAVGIIIGAAFTSIVNSLVGDVIMPVIGVLTSNMDFSDMFVALNGQVYANLAAAKAASAPVIAYGVFLNAVINFMIVAFVVFMLMKQVNRLKRQAEQAPATAPVSPPEDVVLLREIRDALKGTAPVKAAPAKAAAATTTPAKAASKAAAKPKK